MPLTIGGVDFTVEARTEGLRKAITQLKKFEAAVNKSAVSQMKGATKTTAALAKQESALKKALQQTVNLQRQLRKSGAQSAEIGKTTRAFQELTDRLTKGEVSTLRFTRAMDAFNAKTARTKRTIQDLKVGQIGASDAGDKLTNVFKNLESASVLAVGPLSGIGARIRSLNAIFSRSTLIFALVFAGITLVIIGLAKLAFAAAKAGAEFERSFARFEAATGSVANASKEFVFVTDLARELGLELSISARAYSRLTAASSGTVLQGKETEKIFKAVSTAAAALRLNTAEVDGAFRAIEQIMSKGSVQAEELRGQLGERLPGAFNIAARAMNVTTAELGKMLKAGELTAEEFLPKFAEELERTFGAKAKDNVNTVGGAFNNLKTSTFLFLNEFNRVGRITDIVAASFRGLTVVIDAISTQLAILGGKTSSLNEAWYAFVAGKFTLAIAYLGSGALATTTLIEGLRIAAEDATEAVQGLGNSSYLPPALTADFQDFNAVLLQMELKLLAIREGAEGLKLFTELTAPMLEYKRRLDASGVSVAENTLLLARYEILLKKILRAKKIQAAFDASDVSEAKVAKNIKDINEQFTVMIAKLAAIQGGPVDLELFTKFTTPVNAFTKALKGSNIELHLRNAYLAGYKVLLKATLDAIDTAKGVIQLKKLNEQIDTLQEKLEAIQGGSANLELFTKFTTPIKAFTKSLEASTLSLEVQARLLERYKAALKATLDATYIAKGVVQLKGINEQLATMQLKLEALKGGSEALDEFKRFTVPVAAFTKSLEVSNIELEVQAAKLAEFKIALRGIIDAEDALKAAGTSPRSRGDTAAKRIAQANVELAIMYKRIKALRGGPQPLEIFERFTMPVETFRKSLVSAGVSLQIQTELVREFEIALRGIIDAEDAITGAAQASSNAIVNSLEDMLFTSNSLKDSLKDLALELIRIGIRAAILQPLQQVLGQTFSQLGFPVYKPAGGVGGGGPSSGLTNSNLENAARFATGGSFTVGGTGGTDSSLVAFKATPGEHVRINTPAQENMGKGGNSINITINAPGADQGTIARITEIVRTEMVPGIVAGTTASVLNASRRPRFA